MTAEDMTGHDTTPEARAPEVRTPAAPEGVDPGSTEWVVIRPAGDVEDSELADVFEGEWRRRSELDDPAVIETLAPIGIVRAYPTDRVEVSAAGDVGQVYEVPEADDDEEPAD